MDDTARVAVIERLGRLDSNLQNLSERPRLLAHELPEILPLNHRHQEEHRPLMPADVVNRNDAGVVHPRDDLRLALKSLFRLGVEHRRWDEFDGDVPIEHRIAGAIDDTHSSAAQLRHNFVSTCEPGADHR